MQKRSIVATVVVLAVAGSVAYWLKARDDRAATEHKAERDATEAMADLNQANASLTDELKKATLEVATAAMLSVAKAGTVITNDVLPLIDDYLAKLDRAMLLSRVYVGLRPELSREIGTALDNIAVRGQKIHAFRDQLSQLADRAAKGTLAADDLASQLAGAVTSLLSAP